MSHRETVFQLLYGLPQPVIAVDAQGNISMCNPAACHAFALPTTDDLLGTPVQQAIHHAELVNLLSTPASNDRHQIVSNTNRILDVQLSVSPELGTLAIMVDITDLKELDRIKSTFVNSFSRDIRSPLTAIIGYVELLERMGPLNDQQRNFIGRIIFSVQSITVLLNDLLELEKIEAGYEHNREPVALDRIAHYVLQGMHRRIERKALSIETIIAAHLPFVLGNPIQLRQLVSSLMDNAVKYSLSEGRIQVELAAESNFVLLIIADSGIGISPEDQPYIFSKFYRASNVIDIDGTGLGLSMVKSIVDQHHGRIWVESQLNQGTRFTVMLPCYTEESSNE